MRAGTRLARLSSCACILLAAAACSPASQTKSARPTPTPSGVPIAPPKTGVIDQTGGTLTSLDGLVTLTLPPGAVSGPTELSIQEITNLAPGGVGSAYLLGPEGTTFPTPVQIAMKASLATTGLDGLTIAFQEGQGYWIRLMDVARDAAADTLTASTTHFSGWSIVAGSPRDLTGTFTFQTTLDVPFTATGSSTFGFAGTDADAGYYLQSGTITMGTISYGPGVTCVAPAPVLPLFTNVAELTTAPVEFRWGFSGHWNITCTPPQSTPDVTAAFDTAGINLIHCNRGYVGVPVAGPDRMSGTYRIDCGASGAETASWDFRTAACETPCAGQPDPLCHAGVTDCSTGTSVCANGAALADGTSCGTDQVCSGGACVFCTAGLSCSGQPDPLCHAGVTDCSTGTSVCVNGAALADGTSCGTDQVCSGGACVFCTAGLSCSGQPDPLCHAGVTDCSTGTSVCANGAALADGTSCGTDQVCSGGACVFCTAGLSCSGQPDPLCHAGVTDCSTGTSVCVNGAALANGTSCGTDQTCNAGTCVASRTVDVIRRVTFWLDPPAAPQTFPAPDAATATVEALVPDGSGGWVHYPPAPTAFDASGAASIAGVPAGSYLLVFRDGGGVSHVVETTSSAVDLGYDVLGRPDAVPATLPTQVSYALTGQAAGSEVQLTSSGADLWHVATLPTEDWAASGSNLLAAGDVLYLHDLTLAPSCGAYACQVAADWSLQAAAGMTDGAAAVIEAALAPATMSGTIVVEWQTSAFELLLADMNPTATTDAAAHTLLVGASAFPLASPAPVASGGAPVLFRLQQPAGSPLGTLDVAAGMVSYGQFLDSLWNEWRGVDFSARVAYTAPTASTPLVETVSVARREPMVPAPVTPIAPTLGPVRVPLLNGSGAFSSLTGVGTTPTLSWSPPTTGVPTSYVVQVYRLHASGSASVSAPVASFTVAGTSTQVVVPPGLLTAGNTYYARITVRSVPTGDAFDSAPFRTSNLWSEAQTLTGAFSP